MPDKKILFITGSYDPNLTGGTKTDYKIIERVKSSDRITLSILTNKILQYEKKGNIAYNMVYNFKYLSKKNYFKTFDYIIINSRLYTRLFLTIGFIKMLCRTSKILFIHHHFDFETQYGYKKYIYKTLEMYTLKKADGIIIVSPYILDLCKQMGFTKTLYYLEISFEHRNYQSTTLLTKEFLFVGTVEYRKGVDKIVDAIDLLNRENIFVSVNIIGMYDENERYYLSLKKKINEHGLSNQIKFLGRINDEELEKKYSSAYAFIFPSRHEGYGMVLVEAMSFGLPVIACDNSAIPYMVHNEKNGLLVKTDDTTELKNALKRLVNDELLRNRLSSGALEYYKNTRTYDDWNKDIDEFTNKLIDG